MVAVKFYYSPQKIHTAVSENITLKRTERKRNEQKCKLYSNPSLSILYIQTLFCLHCLFSSSDLFSMHRGREKNEGACCWKSVRSGRWHPWHQAMFLSREHGHDGPFMNRKGRAPAILMMRSRPIHSSRLLILPPE